jgi:predicted negative regulator of RcsB-dependent stress response
VELYDTEEQQVEAIKDWWQENGKAVIIGSIVGIAALGSWQYYQDAQQKAQEAASASYDKAIVQLTNKGIDAESNLQSFIDSNSKSEYAVLAAIQLAKAQITAEHLDEALAQLEWAKEHTSNAALSSVIAYRVARVKAEQGAYDEALATLAEITDKGWIGRVAELKGDIALRQNDNDAAYIAYTEAQEAADASQTLQMKLNDLAK